MHMSARWGISTPLYWRAMSQENVEIVRKVYGAAEDASGIEVLLGFATDDFVWTSDPQMPGGGTYRGEAARRYLNETYVFDEAEIDVDEIIDLGDDRVLGITAFRATPRQGRPMEWVWCHLLTFRDGLIAELRSYLDREEALKAAGLSG